MPSPRQIKTAKEFQYGTIRPLDSSMHGSELRKENPMSKIKLLVLVLIAAGVSAAVYWFNQNPPGVTVINPAQQPKPILVQWKL
jgi:hypothetical protein